MSDWTEGYRADINYTHHYFSELSPLHLRLAFLNAGLTPPTVGTACELGFGHGMSVNIHAAATSTRWWGTDFNPSQAAFARDMARASGAGAQLYDDSFADFCARPDLPDFDYICLHGIWSWISDENRAIIVDFIRRKLAVGGVLYISYNTHPGWAAFRPMRDLMAEYVDVMTTPARGIVRRVEEAVTFAEKLLAVDPGYARANPQIKARLEKMKAENKTYVAHEFFNVHWEPMRFSDMAKWLAPAKMQWACSANLADSIDDMNLTKDQQDFVKSFPDPMFQQAIRDFCTNQQFRKDYWVKGRQDLSPLQRLDALRKERVVLVAPRAGLEPKVKASRGEVTLRAEICDPILDVMRTNKPITISEIEQQVKAAGVNFNQIMQAVLALCSTGVIAPVQPDTEVAKARKACDNLNAFNLENAPSRAEVGNLASPLVAGGLKVPQIQQLFLLALRKGLKTPDEWADFAWNTMARQGKKLVKNGKPLETNEENIAEMKAVAAAFAESFLPILKSMQVK